MIHSQDLQALIVDLDPLESFFIEVLDVFDIDLILHIDKDSFASPMGSIVRHVGKEQKSAYLLPFILVITLKPSFHKADHITVNEDMVNLEVLDMTSQ